MRLWVTDVCVPLSKLAEVISETEADFKATSIVQGQQGVVFPCPIVGHVADGNFHCLVSFNSSDPYEVQQIKQLNENLTKRYATNNLTL